MKKSCRLIALLLGLLLLSACAGPEPAAPPAAEEPPGEAEVPVEDDAIVFPMEGESFIEHYNSDGLYIGGLVWEGRLYEPYDPPLMLSVGLGADHLEKYIGTVLSPGQDDEEDGLVPLWGLSSGHYYTVEGYDPGFLLGQRNEFGETRWHLSNNGLTLRTGADLFEEKLHWSDTASVYYTPSWLDRDSGEINRVRFWELNGDLLPRLKDLLNELNGCPFLTEEELAAVWGEENGDMAMREHLRACACLKLPDGFITEIYLAEGGYLCLESYAFRGLWLRGGEAGESLIDLLCRDNGAEITLPAADDPTEADCRADPRYGALIPTELPEDLELGRITLHYALDRETGEITGVKNMSLAWWDGGSRFCSVGLYPLPGLSLRSGYGGPLYRPEELTEELIEICTPRENLAGVPIEHPHTSLGLQIGDTALIWSATDLIPAESLAALRSALAVTLPTMTLAEYYALPGDLKAAAVEWEGRLYLEGGPLYPDAGFSPPEAVEKLLGYKAWENGEQMGETPEGFRADFYGWYYTLKGLDPERFLGRLDPSGAFRLFVCRSGLTVSSGADVLKGLLHTGERFTGFAFQSTAAVREGDNTLSLLPDVKAAQRFLSVLDAARPISWEALKDSLGPRKSMSQALYTLLFRRADGCSLLLELCEGGYCHVPGFEIYLQPEAAAYERFLALLEEELGRETTEPEAALPTLEDLRRDPTFGPLVPACFPPDLDEITVRTSVLVEPETARVSGWESVYLELYFSGGGRLLQLDLLPWELVSAEVKARRPRLSLEELSVEAIEKVSNSHMQEGGEVWTTQVLLRFDGLAMQFSSLGLTPQEVYEVLASIGR